MQVTGPSYRIAKKVEICVIGLGESDAGYKRGLILAAMKLGAGQVTGLLL